MNIRKNVLFLVLASVICLGLVPRATASSTGTVRQTTVVAVGESHSAVIDNNHTLWTWGANQYGQLGNNGASNSTYTASDGDGKSYKTQTIPVKVLEDVISVSCGRFFTAAIKEDGTLWMWGYNEYGQLGDGTRSNRYAPVKVLDQVVAVSCGYSFTAAIRYDGSLWMWGHNLYGSLGTGGATNSSVSGLGGITIPIQTVPIKIMDHVAAVSCGNWHTAAVKTDGTLWVWGDNGSGELGLRKDTRTQLTPIQVRSQVKTIYCGYDSALFMDSNGSLTVWGSYLKPLPTWSNIKEISWNSGWTSAYIRADGSLWTRGNNYEDFDRCREYMKRMDNVCAVACSSNHILAVQTDGSVWAWGFNGYGQVGNGGLGEYDEAWGSYSGQLLQKTPNKLDITAAVPGSSASVLTNTLKSNNGATVSTWALETVNSAEENNLVPDSLASGNMTKNITRADFAAVAVKLYETLIGETVQARNNPFTDTNDTEILKAYSLGIVNGTSPSTFDPELPVTREQAAVMLTNVYTALGHSVPQVSATSFADNGSISTWALDAVSFMSEKEIVNGVGNNMFDPKGNASAEQALVISYRVFTALKH